MLDRVQRIGTEIGLVGRLMPLIRFDPMRFDSIRELAVVVFLQLSAAFIEEPPRGANSPAIDSRLPAAPFEVTAE